MTSKKAEPKVITADGILKALAGGAKSLTGVAKLLGYKSGSSATLKKIIQVVPDIEDRLAINVPAKDIPNKDAPKVVASKAKPKAGKKLVKAVPEKKPAVKKTASNEYPMPECVPYRASSGYALAWSILFAHREKGISKADLLSAYKKVSGKPDANCGYDIHVVVSPREDGSCHRSAGKASQTYWVEKQNDWYRLHIIGEDKR